MFTTDLKEGQTDVVELKDMTEESVTKVCNLVTTSKIEIPVWAKFTLLRPGLWPGFSPRRTAKFS